MPPDSDVVYGWRGEFDNAEVNRLHAEGFEHRLLDIVKELLTHSSAALERFPELKFRLCRGCPFRCCRSFFCSRGVMRVWTCVLSSFLCDG